MKIQRWIQTCVPALVAVSQACVATMPDPVVETVDPPRGYGGEAQRIDVYGRDFFPRVVADMSGSSGDTVDAAFRMALLDPESGSVVAELSRVTLIDTGHLQGEVPREVAPVGSYDLRVTGPDGATGLLEDGYQVTSSPVERLAVVVRDDPGSFYVGQTAILDLQLLGRDDAEEFAELPIDVVVARLDGLPVDGTLTSNLTDAVYTDLGGTLGISGFTRVDGSGRLDLAIEAPADVKVSVQIPDPDVGLEPEVRTLRWLPGGDYVVDLTLPTDDFSTVAGSDVPVTLTLRDSESGGVVYDPVLPVQALVYDTCGDLGSGGGILIDDLKGVTELPFELTTATRDRTPIGGCAEQRIVVELDGTPFSSPRIQVDPGAADALRVDVLKSVVTAGETQTAIVYSADRYGNVTREGVDEDSLALTDSANDVDVRGCDPIDFGALCEFTPTDAEIAVTLLVESPTRDLHGRSRLYEVLPAVADRLGVEIDPDTVASGVTAGVPFPVRVAVLDEFDNIVDPEVVAASEALGPGLIVLDDAQHGGATCDWLGVSESLRIDFRCHLYTYGPTWLSAATTDPDAPALSGRSVSVGVVNGPLDRAELTLGLTKVTAGSPLSLSIRTYDAWDNPYVVRSSDRIDLSDTLGGIDVDHIMLGAEGRGTATIELEKAGETRVVASRSGAILGTSEVVVVEPDSASALEISVDEPWGFVGDAASVTVQAVDAYGNHTVLGDPVSITSRRGTFGSVSVGLVDGRGTASIAFDHPHLAEEITGRTSGGLTGMRSGFLVVEDCGSSGPNLSLLFDGEDDAVVCHDGDSGEVDADFAGSTTASGSTPSVHGLWVEGAGASLGSATRQSVESVRVGELEVRGLVADAAACGVEVVRTAWVGPDDGQPVGPLDLSLSTTSLEAGADTATLSLSGVTTCDGSVAKKADVLLRTDRGLIAGAGTSGHGLEVTLDSSGDGAATLDLRTARGAGAGMVTAWVESGAARATRSFTVTKDRELPRLLDQDPLGYSADSLDTIELTFSEPIDSDTVSASSFAVTGPAGLVAIDSVGLSEDRRTAWIWLDDIVDASLARYTLTAESTLTDDDGNGLDGAWSGFASDHYGDFGKVSAVAPDLTSCTPSSAIIRPDGDPATGAEADQVDLTLKATRNASLWRLEVISPSGSRVEVVERPTTLRTGVVSWDGRDFSERIVPDGTYTLLSVAQNSDGTAGTACVETVVVDNARDH